MFPCALLLFMSVIHSFVLAFSADSVTLEEEYGSLTATKIHVYTSNHKVIFSFSTKRKDSDSSTLIHPTVTMRIRSHYKYGYRGAGVGNKYLMTILSQTFTLKGKVITVYKYTHV